MKNGEKSSEYYPKVFIIVLNYNGRDVIKRCLGSVFSVDYPNAEVVVVDNGSTDGSFEMMKAAYPRLNIIRNEENLGFSAGNNLGIRFALEKGAGYVLLLNYDTEVEPGFLKKLVETAEKEERIGVLSPKIYKNKRKEIWFSGARIDWLRMKTRHDFSEKTGFWHRSDILTGCAMMIRAEVFRKIGFLDEEFFLYWEDVDFSLRARKAGLINAVVPQSAVYHAEKSEQAKTNKVYWLVISGLIFFKKNSPWYLKPWIKLYVLGRRMKNRRDVKRSRNEINEAVKKAYDDFRKFCRK